MTLALVPPNPAAAAGWIFLSLAVGAAWQQARKTELAGRIGWTWWVLCGAALLCFRWTLLWVPHQQNPDESQLIAGAITLLHDPVFWRSVDGGTAGPLDFFPLLPAAWAEGAASYAIARLIAAALVFATIVFAGETAALVAGAAMARMVSLPAIAFYAFTTNPDFNHYSTEIMPALLLAAAGYTAVRNERSPSNGALWLFAMLTGSVLWAKLQAVPLAAALWGVVAVREMARRRFRSLLPLLGGAVLPALGCFGMATVAGEIEHLVIPYLAQNLAYVKAPQFTWFGVAAAQWGNAMLDGYLGMWLAGSAITVALSLALLFRRPANRTRQTTMAIALLLFVAAVLSALGPRRPSTHHLFLLVVPLIWLGAAALALPMEGRRRWIAGVMFLGACLTPQMAWRWLARDPFAAINASGVSEERRELARLVRTLATRSEPLAMWGWRCSLYVEAGRRQATRQAHTEAQIYESELQPYFLRRYLEDFQAGNPPVFVDAVGPGNFAFDSPRVAHETFLPLREIVRNRYTLVATLDGTRVYARNDRLAELNGPTPEKPQP